MPLKTERRAQRTNSGAQELSQKGRQALSQIMLAAIEEISEGIAVCDLSGNLLALNNAFAQMHGFHPEELRGKHISVFHTPAQMPAVNAANNELFRADFFRGEIWHARRDGTTFLGLMHNYVLRDAAGHPTGFIGTLSDITELKRSEEALVQSQHMLKEAEKIAHMGSWEWDMLNNAETWSDELFRIIGYAPGKIRTTHGNFIKALHPDDRDHVLKALQQAVSGNEPYKVEYRIIRPDRTQRTVLAQGELYKNAHGQPVKMVGSALDITEKKRQEEALLDSEARFRALAESSADAIMITDQQAVVTFWNKAATRILGYEAHEILGKSNRVLIPSQIVESHQELKQKFLKTGTPIRGEQPFETTVLKKDGAEIPVETTISSWKIRDQFYFSFIIRDISKRKQTEALLLAREKELQLQTQNLEETNTALKALLRNRDETRAEQDEKILTNAKDLIGPYIKKLKQSQLSSKQQALLGIIESCLEQIISPFAHSLKSKYYNLTRQELQVAALVREGKQTREIAHALNSSVRAVEFHRNNLRNKLGIKKHKINLRSYLMSLLE